MIFAMSRVTDSYALLLLALALLVLELFVPSSGLISVLAGAAVIASIVVAFAHSVAFGTFQLASAAILIPVLVAAMIRWWPHSTIGRLILNIPPEGDSRLSDAGTDASLAMLLGRVGKAKSKMLPSGAIRIDGRTYDAVTRGVAIDQGQFVEVVEVKGTRIVVVPIDENRARAVESEQMPTQDTLSRPIDDLITDPFEDPLA